MSERKSLEKRRHARAKKRFAVRFGPSDLAHSGFTQDISGTGLFLQTGIIYPPGTVLVLQIDYPEKALTHRGVVRWSKDLPPAFRRSLRGGMGVEFTTQTGQGVSLSPQASTVPSESLPEVSEKELGRGATSRRQMSTLAGNTYEVFQTEYLGGIHVRLFQLPRTEGSADAVFRRACRTREEADAAVKAFLKEH